MDPISERHLENTKNQLLYISVSFLVTLLLAFLSLGLGSSASLDLFTTIKILFGFETGSEMQLAIIWEIRFPRILMAIVGGAALAIAGSLMQGCLGNPLVSPLTLGIASGAALGAAMAMVFEFSINSNSDLATVANAFIFSLIVVAVIIQLGNFRSVSAESYILVGIAVTFIAGALISIMQYFATDTQLSQLAHWSFGSLSRPTLGNTLWISVALIGLLPSALKKAWDLNSLALGGDDFAISTGVDPVKIRKETLILSALISSIVISFTGLIGFVGLLAPHLGRSIVGNDYRKLIPCSAIFCSLLMLTADTVGRTLFAPIIMPAGLMLSMVGGPFFMYLLIRSRGVDS